MSKTYLLNGFLLALVATALVASAKPTTTRGDVTTVAAAEDTLTSTVDSMSVNLEDASATTTASVESDTESSDTEAGLEPRGLRVASTSDENSLNEHSNKLSSVDTNSDDENQDEPASRGPNSHQPLHLNMSQLDAAYSRGQRPSEQEVVDSWRRMNKKLKKGIGSLIGLVVPLALNITQEAKISSNCTGAMLKWVLSMNQLKLWALRMLDASGKPIAGLLEGSLTMFGNYRQCLKIRAPDDDEIEFAGEFREYFRGKYCVIQAKPLLPDKSRFYNFNTKIKSLTESDDGDDANPAYDKTVFEEFSEWALAFNFVNLRMDLCLPSVCTREDIQKTVSYLTQGIDIKSRVLRCETDSYQNGFGPAVEVADDGQQPFAAASSIEHHLDSFNQLGWLLVPAIAIGLVLVATALSMAMRDDEDAELVDSLKTNKFSHTIKSLSLKRSISSHLNVDYEQLADDKPLALYGVRLILVMWVILVESAVNLKFEYLRELLMLKDLIFWWPLQIIINSTLQFDSFILLAAFTMAYKNCLTNNGVTNAKHLVKYVLDKYIRLMPSIMVMVAMVILLPLLYRGPVWNDYVARQSMVCQSSGWLNTAFLQNYLPYKEICLPQTWLLCVELQLVLLMAPLVYYLNKSYLANLNGATSGDNNNNNKKQQKQQQQHHQQQQVADANKPFYWLKTLPGLAILCCMIAGGAASFYNVYTNELPPSWFYTMPDPDSKSLYFSHHLTKLWTHLAVFALGLLAGIECRRASRNVVAASTSSYRRFNLSAHYRGFRNKQPHKLVSASSTSSLPVMMRSSQSSLTSSNSHLASLSAISIDVAQFPAGSNESIKPLNSSDYDVDTGDDARGCCRLLVDIVGCLAAITTMTLIIFSTHQWSISELPSPLLAATFDAGSRLLWSLALVWLLYQVSVPRLRVGGRSLSSSSNNNDHDGGLQFNLLARLLGHPVMVSLGKLSFLIYIIHPLVHTTVLAIQEQPIYSSWLMLFHIMLGNMTLTLLLASMMSLFVEMPCRNLFRRCGHSLLLTQAVGGTTSAAAAATAATTTTTAAAARTG